MERASIADVRIELPSAEVIWNVLTLQAGFNSATVVMGATLLGIAAGFVGTFALLRKRSLMGDALAHCALPGLCVAYIGAILLGFQGRNLYLLLSGAAVAGVLGILTVQFLVRRTRLTEDAAVGAVLSVFFGMGIVLLSVIQNMATGSEGGLHHFIYGQTAAMNRSDAVLLASAALLCLILCVLFMKEFRVVCFDAEFAAVNGWPITRIDLLMMSLVVIVTIIGLQAVGLILIVALLIVPAAAARFWTERLNVLLALSAFFGGLSGYAGSVLSSLLPRLPAGAVIVLTAGVLFILSFLFAPERGVVSNFLRHAATRARIGREHLLRDLYEGLEIETPNGTNGARRVSIEGLPALNHISSTGIFLRLTMFGLTKLVSYDSKRRQLRLTEEGYKEAGRLTKNHRLWEEYIHRFGGLDTAHVDYSADKAEHVLSPDLVAQLESALRNAGRLPPSLDKLPSIHSLPLSVGGK